MRDEYIFLKDFISCEYNCYFVLKLFEMLKIRFSYIFLILAVVMVGCAKRGSITGGLKDTIPPVLRSSSPENYSTNFNAKEIRITFDEYIKIKDVNKQLIVSPPMKYPPVVTPTSASKYINIRIKDTLLPNTTYSFNFGSSIQDNNEGNPFQQFKYVFSTGTYIDSLSLQGIIKDSYKKEVDNFVSVMLYEVNDTFNDSVIYKQNPRYITNTLDSLKTFKLENLKEGTYLLVALKDVNNNYRFNPKSEKIGFHKEFIKIPNDTIYEIELFQETLTFKATKPYQASGNRIVVPYEGENKDVNITLKNRNDLLPIKITKFPEKDSLQVWLKPIKTDSVSVALRKNNFEKDFKIRYKDQKKDTLSFSAKPSGTLNFREKLTITSSIPLINIDNSKMKLINKDSVAVDFTSEYDEFNQELKIDFVKEPLERYTFNVFPGALTDFYEKTNDTLSYKLTTQNTSEYANLKITLKNVKQFPIIVELTNPKGDVLASDYSDGNPVVDFIGLLPNDFTVRVIYDENKNRVWDPGNYLEKRQGEEVLYFPSIIHLGANWEGDETIDLKTLE